MSKPEEDADVAGLWITKNPLARGLRQGTLNLDDLSRRVRRAYQTAQPSNGLSSWVGLKARIPPSTASSARQKAKCAILPGLSSQGNSNSSKGQLVRHGR